MRRLLKNAIVKLLKDDVMKYFSLVYFELKPMHNHCFFIKKILNHIWALNNFKKHFFFQPIFQKFCPIFFQLILHFLKFCNEGDLIFYYVASGIFWCMQSKNALQRQREGIDSKTGIQGILVSSCSYWHMHAVQWQQGEPNKIRDNFWKICLLLK